MTRCSSGTLASSRAAGSARTPCAWNGAGAFLHSRPAAGSFRASVDGRTFAHVNCDIRNGYGYQLFGKELEPRLHKLLIRPLSDRPVKLGYLLVAATPQQQPAWHRRDR